MYSTTFSSLQMQELGQPPEDIVSALSAGGDMPQMPQLPNMGADGQCSIM